MSALPTRILPQDFRDWQRLFLQSLPLGSTGSAGSSCRVFLVFPLFCCSGWVRCSADVLREVSGVLRTCASRTGVVSTLRKGLIVHLNRQPKCPKGIFWPYLNTRSAQSEGFRQHSVANQQWGSSKALRLSMIRRNLPLQFTGKQTWTRDEWEQGIRVITSQCETDRLGKNWVNRC